MDRNLRICWCLLRAPVPTPFKQEDAFANSRVATLAPRNEFGTHPRSLPSAQPLKMREKFIKLRLFIEIFFHQLARVFAHLLVGIWV